METNKILMLKGIEIDDRHVLQDLVMALRGDRNQIDLFTLDHAGLEAGVDLRVGHRRAGHADGRRNIRQQGRGNDAHLDPLQIVHASDGTDIVRKVPEADLHTVRDLDAELLHIRIEHPGLIADQRSLLILIGVIQERELQGIQLIRIIGKRRGGAAGRLDRTVDDLLQQLILITQRIICVVFHNDPAIASLCDQLIEFQAHNAVGQVIVARMAHHDLDLTRRSSIVLSVCSTAAAGISARRVDHGSAGGKTQGERGGKHESKHFFHVHFHLLHSNFVGTL